MSPEGDVGPSLGRLVDCPRPVVDDEVLLAVLAAAVAARNLLDVVIASAVVAAERVGVPGRRHLRSGADLLRLVGMAPGAAARAVRVGRMAPALPALTTAQRLGGIGIEFADAVGKGVTHIESRVALSDDDRAAVVTKLMVQTTPAEVAAKARAIALDRIAALPVEQRVVPVAEDTTLNEMTVVQNAEGRFEATLDLDIGTGEELCAALDPLCRPVPLPDGTPDPRPIGARRAEAIGQVLRTYLSQSARPMSGGVLPHVTLIRRDQPRQRGAALPATPHPHPSRWLAGLPRPRPPPLVHPTPHTRRARTGAPALPRPPHHDRPTGSCLIRKPQRTLITEQRTRRRQGLSWPRRQTAGVSSVPTPRSR
ncbi:DUF222 domain-containing protein [Mycolicibacterium neoaurum]|uniref:DUF222 domain-containing protein n=1 Tax=Mycolicibacterium neoaurum TaxID=1795 RepID=UPI001F24BD53|nr:DUF222 domain-containing protein [Mycolicibacterium neoaurum]